MKHNADHAGISIKNIFFLILLISGSYTSYSQTTYYSRNAATAPRNWDEADSWTLNADGSGAAAAIPGRTDNVVILNGHTIIVNNTADNGSAAVSANALGQANVGTFVNSGAGNFYQTGNIYVKSGGTLSASSRLMLGGTTTIDGTLTTTQDIIIIGRLEVSLNATTSIGDDLILSGFSETLIYNTTTSSDDLYMDHTDAQLCGNNTVDLGDVIQYLNGATSDQLCSDIQVTGCGTCPTSGTGSNNIGTDQNLLHTGAVWRYLDDGTNQGTAWIPSSFDDSGWSSGNAELGYGDGDEATTVSFGADANNKHTTTYFRTSFFVNDRSNYTKILANINFDDGVVVYINGNEVVRSNMPTGTISSSTFASGTIANENVFQEFTLSVFDLVNGTNYVAVEVHQANLTSSDISFDMEITGSFSTELINAGETWNYLDDGSDQGTAWTGTSFDDSGWSSGDAELGYGDGDEITTLGFGGDANNKYPTTYFRKSFDNTDATVFALKIGLRRDDGAIVYLNGNEIVRDNMPAGTVDYLDLASATIGGIDESTFFSFEVDPSDLIVGTNVIAVEVHQADVTSSDISFDLTLELVQGGVLLPVSLIDFKGKPGIKGGIDLTWSTATETNNDYFKVEYSQDGINFEQLAKVDGSGTTHSITHYGLTDWTAKRGHNYYRLSQYDFDGQYEIFNTIQVNFEQNTPVNLIVYPNPAVDQVLLRLSDGRTPDSIQLFDMAGNEHVVNQTTNENLITLQLNQLKKGTYVLKSVFNGQVSSQMIQIK